MTLIVDASIACKWLVEEEGSHQALKVLELGDALLAPDLILIEVCSVLWKKHRLGEITREHALSAQLSLPDFFDQLVPCQDFSIAALDIAISLDHPVYDCFYLAVAENYDHPLVTADKRLLNRLTNSNRTGLAIGLNDLESKR